MKNEKFDFGQIISNVDKVKKMKSGEKKRRPSVKPLKFEISPEDSPLKAAIVERINSRDLTYADIYDYCTNIQNGDTDAGQDMGYNIIWGLKKRHTMIDTTFSLLCDFLKLDVMLVEREKTEEDENDETN